jgi:siroheme synthase-like protein
MSDYYPIFLNIRGKKCVVVGGGEVAERKVRGLVEHHPSILVISPHISEGLGELAAQGLIKVVRRDYRPGDLKDALVVIAATDDPEVNNLVADEGQGRGALVNVVDTPQSSNFIVPALVRRGDVCIAISTGGRSPALSRKIRTQLERSLAQEYASLALLLAEVRRELRGRRAEVGGEAWQGALDLDLLLDMLKKGEFEQARRRLLSDLVGKGKDEA